MVQGFEKQGLGTLVSSWVGTGQTLPISPEPVQHGLGAGLVQQLAQSAGLTESATTSALSGLLPSVIDRLTPGGAVPQADQLAQLVGSLRTAIGGWRAYTGRAPASCGNSAIVRRRRPRERSLRKKPPWHPCTPMQWTAT
jgi:hypothetical protein